MLSPAPEGWIESLALVVLPYGKSYVSNNTVKRVWRLDVGAGSAAQMDWPALSVAALEAVQGGSRLINLTDSPAADRSPVWSPVP